MEKTGNYINGAVIYLSFYISRGVISTKLVLQTVKNKGYSSQKDIITFVKELCWRDYFRRVGQEKKLDNEIRQKQDGFFSTGIPAQIMDANTGIASIDTGAQQLYDRGYMQNHLRITLHHWFAILQNTIGVNMRNARTTTCWTVTGQAMRVAGNGLPMQIALANISLTRRT